MQINESSLADAIVEYVELLDRTQNHIHLRVDADGKPYVSEDTSYCISEGEFNREPGSTITVKHEQGNGQCNLAEDWAEMDEGIETIATLTTAVLEDLTRLGIEVELV